MITSTVIIISLLLLNILSFYLGWQYRKKRIEKKKGGKRLEEYEFYPFVKSKDGQVEFSLKLFDEAVQFFLGHRNEIAARELIIIGEQNIVRDTASSKTLARYRELYEKYDGKTIISDNNQFLENYKRIVQLVGRSFPQAGIEILLHNLVNPARSIIAIENGEITGRRIDHGTTNLVLDLKTRKLHNQDKLNYSLAIGARNFKCTTIPIFRRDYGLVGAICINVDVNYLKEEVLSSHYKMVSFLEHLTKVDFHLNENILSKAEYRRALAGKRHYAQLEPVQIENVTPSNRQLLAIMFSDIVEFSKMMGNNEAKAMEILAYNRTRHIDAIYKNHGTFLKEMGDGILASFQSAFHAVSCAKYLLNPQNNEKAYQLRIGIHLGEVLSAGGDVYGDGVNIASRIHALSVPGTLCVSAEVYNNIKNKLNLQVTELGSPQLKNISQKLILYQMALPA